MLIYPPVRAGTFYDKMATQPMGLSYLAAVLRDRYQVKILDAAVLGYDQERPVNWNFMEYGLSYQQIIKEVEKFQPQVVGISCIFSAALPVVAEICKNVKKLSADIITVTGGTHPSFLPEDSFRRAPELDFIIKSEGELSFLELLAALEKGTSLEQVDGLAWKENGQVRQTPKTRWVENLDQLPFPARDLLPLEEYFKINVPFMFYSRHPRNVSFCSSRGCPFNCAFCSSCNHWGNRVRYRSVENALAEMRELKDRYQVREIKFEEDNLLLNKERAKKLFRAMIEEKFNFHWNMPNGTYIMSLLDQELVRLMKESGCYEVILAFESGCQEVLDNIIHKPLDLSKTERVIKNLRDNDIDIHAFFIVGFPGETREQIKQTFRFARTAGLDKGYVFMFNPLPGSALYKECIDKGYYDPELVFQANYANTACTTSEFNPPMLRRWQQAYSIGQNFDLLFKNPAKLFGKYLGRMARRRNFRAINMALRTFLLGLFKQ